MKRRRALIETVAMGTGAWDALPEQSRRAFIHNAPTWLDTAHDPTYGTLDIHQLAGITAPVLVTGGGHSDPVDLVP